jgi:hypothetical protein
LLGDDRGTVAGGQQAVVRGMCMVLGSENACLRGACTVSGGELTVKRGARYHLLAAADARLSADLGELGGQLVV